MIQRKKREALVTGQRRVSLASPLWLAISHGVAVIVQVETETLPHQHLLSSEQTAVTNPEKTTIILSDITNKFTNCVGPLN